MNFYWHIHHDSLLELSDNIQERIDSIKADKPKKEIPIRLRLLKPVRGPLPEPVLQAKAECDRTGAEYDKANAAHVKAWAEYEKATTQYDIILWKYWPEIEALHREECPDCPWNGSTIFP